MPCYVTIYNLTVMTDLRRISRYWILAALGFLLAMILNCGDDESPAIFKPDNPDTTTPPGGDSAQPQPVTDPRLTYSLPDGEAYLEWTAPADDTVDEPVVRYEVRYSYTSQFKIFWDLGIIHPSPPDPGRPGQTEFLTIKAPTRGKNLYAAIRAYDESENPSIIDSVASIHIPGYNLSGQCLDAYTGQPIQGLTVKAMANILRTCTTDAEGRFSSGDLTAGAAFVSITTGVAAADYHPQGKAFALTDDIHYTYYCIPVRQTESPHFCNLLELFKVLTRTSDAHTSTILATWRKRPVKCYVPEYVNTNGVDYTAETRAALQRWTEKAGTELFTFVDAPPDTGIIFRFKTRAEMGIHLGLTSHTYDSERHPLIDEVSVVNNYTLSSALYLVLLHEIGHTIQFGHVPFGSFIMYERQPLPADISQDETDVLKLLLALPTRLNMANYDVTCP